MLTHAASLPRIPGSGICLLQVRARLHLDFSFWPSADIREDCQLYDKLIKSGVQARYCHYIGNPKPRQHSPAAISVPTNMSKRIDLSYPPGQDIIRAASTP